MRTTRRWQRRGSASSRRSGYCAFLAGPPLVGFLGHQVGVLQAFTSVAALLAAAFLLAGNVRTIAAPDRADDDIALTS